MYTHEVYVLILLMTSWLDYFCFENKYEVIEYFAGVARISRLGTMAGLKTAAVDIKYASRKHKRKKRKKHRKHRSTNSMDINSESGFVLLSPM